MSQSVSAQLSQYQPELTPARAGAGGVNRQGQGGGRGGGGGRGKGGGGGGGGEHQGLDWLRDSVPGEPGVDYPVFSLPVPENSFR